MHRDLLLTHPHPLASTRLLAIITSNHRLAVEVLRWARSGVDYIPERWRLCRFCQSDVEDELHAFMICDGFRDLVTARSVFRPSDIFNIDPDLMYISDPFVLMTTILRRPDTIGRVAMYLHTLHTIFTSVPIIIPPVDAYRTIIS
jgi:hypothetical protein